MNTDTGKDGKYNLEMSTKLFDKEVIFSVDSKVFGEGLYELFGDTIGRYDSENNRVFFYIFKDNKTYPDVKMRLEKINSVIREAGDMIWVRFGIPVLINEEMNKTLEGKPFIQMSDAMIYPFILMKEKRVSFIVQYNSKIENEVGKRLLSLNEVYDKNFWHGAFRIEYVGSSRSIEEIIQNSGVIANIKLIEVKLNRRENKRQIFEKINEKITPWPTMKDGMITTMHFEEILNYVDGPEEAIKEFFTKFTRKSISSIYLESYIQEDSVIFRTLIEYDLLDGMMDNFYDSVVSGIDIDILSVKDPKNDYNKCDCDDFINLEFFDRQAIFSVDITKAYPEYLGFLNSGIAYYDTKYRKYYFSILKTEDRYIEQKLKMRGKENLMKEDENMIWISFDNITLTNETMKSMLEGEKILDMDDVIFYPTAVINNGKIFHLIQYTNESSIDVSKRLSILSASHNRIFGRGTFRIYEIGNPESLGQFVTRFLKKSDIREISIDIPSELNARGIAKNLSMDYKDIKFVVKWGEEMSTVDLEILVKGLGIPENIMYESFRNVLSGYIIPLYFEATCGGGKCRVNWLYEGRSLNYLLKNLAKINENGQFITLREIKSLS